MKTFLLLVMGVLMFSCGKHSPALPSSVQYSLSGTGTTTLVFVHGWCINRSYWDAQERFFSPNYQVLTLDLAGHGTNHTRHDHWSMEQYAEDIARLIESLDLKRVVLIGHSMAGDINLHVYEKIMPRVIGFIGIDNFHEIGKEYTEDEKKQTAQVLSLLRTNFPQLVQQIAEANLFSPQTDSTVRKRVIQDLCSADATMAIALMESLSVQNVQEQRLAPLLQVPLMLVNSDVGVVNENQLKKYCGSGYKIRTVHGSGHYPMIEVPDECNARLAETIADIESR